jgi:hypothetical protein
VAVGGGGVNDQVYISEFETEVKRFDPVTKTLSTFATAPLEAPRGVAVDSSSGPSSGDVYVADVGSNVVDKFDATGKLVGQLSQTPEGPFAHTVRSVAVDPANGDVYLAEAESNGVVYEFGPTGVFLGELKGSQTAAGSMEPNGVAVDTSGDVYVTDKEHLSVKHHYVDVFGPGVVVPGVITGAASEVKPTSVKLEGTVNPAEQPVSECRFEYGTSEAYGQTALCEPPAADILPADNNDHPVTAKLSGLESGMTYHYRLEAANGNGVARYGKDATVTTLPRPAISGEVASNVTLGSADLEARIDPNGTEPATYETTYSFEYGTSTSYGTILPVPDGKIAAGMSPVLEVQHIEKLAENRTYHWRVVASNGNGTTYGVDHTFVYDTSGAGLPDNRAYEMVTPPQKNSALIGDAPVLGLPPAVSEDGSRVMAPSIQCFAGAQSCTAKQVVVGTPYQFSRTAAGWRARALAPPASVLSSSSTENYGENGAVLFAGPTPPHEEDDFYARLPEAGSLFDVGPVTPPEAGARGPGSIDPSPYGTGDLSHLVWYVVNGSTWPSLDKTRGVDSAYEYVGRGNAQPVLVGVDNSGNLISVCETEIGGSLFESGAAALSADGRTVYFTAVGTDQPTCGGTASPPVSEVFARIDNGEPGAHTVPISEPSAFSAAAPYFGCEAEPCVKDVNVAANFRDGWFVDASADGSKAVFTSTQQLTDGASEDPSHADSALSNGCETTGGAGGCNLYEHDSAAPAGHQLIDLSAGDSSGGGPRVQGVVAISPDGSHVYFVAHGVLTRAANGQGQTARDGAENLYLSQNGQTTFIATLPSSDAEQWRFGAKSANVTPEGRFLVFMSHGRLTPDATSRSGALQVFRYDSETGELTRISIGKDGFNDNGNRSSPTPCKGAGFGCSEDAGIVHGYTTHLLGVPRRDPTMSNDGSYVFFQSPVALTAHALDDVQIATEESGDPVYAQNVYEWHAGHVSLISDGRDVSVDNAPPGVCPQGNHPSSVCLLGSDATGSNVFFTTADQLVPEDTDTELDFYDARICTGASPCLKPVPAPSPPCLGEACHGIPAGTPSLLTPGTVSFNGAGNITPAPPAKQKSLTKAQKLARALASCRKRYKHSRKRRTTCEKQAHRAYGATARRATRAAKIATNDRRAGR